MEVYDIIMLAILGGSVLFGFWKGFAWQIASVAAFVVSYLVAAQFHPQVAGYFDINPFIAMFLLFIATSLAIWIGYGFIHRQIEQMHLKSFDRQIGAIVGPGSGIAICLTVTFFAVTVFGESMGHKVVRSTSGGYITRLIDKLDGVLPDGVHAKVEPYLNQIDEEMTNARNRPEPVVSDGDNPASEEANPAVPRPLTEHEKWIKEIEKMLQED